MKNLISVSQISELVLFPGLMHIWGKAGSGKTSLAVALASYASRKGPVEWICTDGKKLFLPQLKKNIIQQRGNIDTVTVQIPQSYHESQQAILNLVEDISPLTKCIVIDSITRALDMSHDESQLWGRELIEEVLPTLASLSLARRIQIIITSEIREIPDRGPVPVLHDVINRWSDVELAVRKSVNPRVSEIFLYSSNSPEFSLIGSISLNSNQVASLHDTDTEKTIGGHSSVQQGTV
ncbi:MAG: AAA family ATPase [Candidatus Lokiarchaeota archaeon]|nr:AAA family ATPase [Candidatus Lokiarchaeota archaeon]